MRRCLHPQLQPGIVCRRDEREDVRDVTFVAAGIAGGRGAANYIMSALGLFRVRLRRLSSPTIEALLHQPHDFAIGYRMLCQVSISFVIAVGSMETWRPSS